MSEKKVFSIGEPAGALCEICLEPIEIDIQDKGKRWAFGTIYENPWHNGRSFFIHMGRICFEPENDERPLIFQCEFCSRLIDRHPPNNKKYLYYRVIGGLWVCLRCVIDYSSRDFLVIKRSKNENITK